MNKKNIILIIIILGAIAIGLAGYYFIAKKELTPVTVRLKWFHQAQFAGMYVAKEKGFYEKAGLDVIFKEVDRGGRSRLEEVVDGDVDFAIVGSIEFLQGIADGLSIKALAAVYQESPYAFASLKESNITTPSDLIGKVIGFTGGRRISSVPIDALLDVYGLDPNDVVLKDLDFDEVKNLVEKNADAITVFRTNNPYALEKAGLEYNLLLPERFGFQMYEDILVASRRHIDENPDLVKRFIQATIAGWEYAIAHREEAINLSLQYATDSAYQDRERQKFILEESIPLIKPTGGRAIGSMNFVRWQRIYNIAEGEGLLSSDFDVSDVYTTEFLK